MESSIITALITASAAILALYIKKRHDASAGSKRDEKIAAEEAERKKSKQNKKVFDHLIGIRTVSRQQIESLEVIQERIENAGGDLNQQEVRTTFKVMRSATSSQTDVALIVGLTCPAVRDRWFDFLSLRTRYMEEVDEFMRDASPERRSELGHLLEQLKAARSDLVEAMKIAARDLGHPLLVRDFNIDDSGAP